nr:hypothetical protein [Tanacetum cinerariifolium]
ESDFEAHPEDDDDEDPVDYLADEGDDGDDEEESSEDDEDDDMVVEADKEEEEEPPAPADSIVLPSASRREDRPEVTLPPRKRLDIDLSPRYEVGESSSAAAARPAGGLREDYG